MQTVLETLSSEDKVVCGQWVESLGQDDSLEKEMATHSTTLAWKIPWTEEPVVHGVAESDTTERLHFTLWVELYLLLKDKFKSYPPILQKGNKGSFIQYGRGLYKKMVL